MTIKLPPLPEPDALAANPAKAIRTAQREAALMVLEKVMNECKKEYAEWSDSMGASGAHLFFVRLRDLRTELEAS